MMSLNDNPDGHQRGMISLIAGKKKKPDSCQRVI